jgi:hypothetical protein
MEPGYSQSASREDAYLASLALQPKDVSPDDIYEVSI